jgi:hypothetical protein
MFVDTTTGSAVTEYEFRALFPSTSFPLFISEGDLIGTGFAKVIEPNPPECSDSEKVVYGDIRLVDGKWVRTFSVVAKTPAELSVALMDEVLLLEGKITQRRLREAVLGTDGGWLAGIEAQIESIRSQIRV